MKKIFTTICAISILGFASSCTKDNSVAPASKSTKTVVADKTDVGQYD